MTQAHLDTNGVTRRAFIRWAALGSGALTLAACTPATPPAALPATTAPSSTRSNTGLVGAEVKVGALFPITGRFTDFARKNRVALELAVEEINARGGIDGVAVRPVIADDGSQPTEAANLVRKLSGDDKVLAILGPFSTAEAEVAFPVANQLKVPVIAPASSKPGLGKASRPWAFRNNVDEARAAVPAIKKWVEVYKIQRAVVVLDVKDAVSQDLGANVLPAAAKQNGVTIVNDGDFATYQTSDIDFTAQVTKLRGLDFQGILFGGMFGDAANFLIEARKQGLKQPLVGGSPLFNDNFLKNGGMAVDGTILPTTFYPDLPDPKVQEFVSRFRDRARAANLPVSEPDFSDVNIYNDVYLLADLIKQQGVTNRPEDLEKDRDKIMQGLTHTQNWPGLAGTVGFNEDGDGLRPIYVVKAEAGKWVGMD